MIENDWTTPTLREAPFWKPGMSPEEYEEEREYLRQNFKAFLENNYEPLWKQREHGETRYHEMNPKK